MTDGGTDAPLTPDEDDAVARLLADAGGPVAIPDDVAARLDAVIAGLEKERAGGADGSGAGVVELRARRRWPRVLLAAAAVVVGGYAVGTVATQGSLSGSDGESSAGSDSAGDSMVLEDRPPAQDQDGSDAGSGAPSKQRLKESREEMSSDLAGVPVVVRLRPERLDAGTLRALRTLEELSSTAMSQDSESSCPPPGLGPRERSLPVRYAGEVAVLVAGPERSGAVEVTVYDCTGAELDRTVVRP